MALQYTCLFRFTFTLINKKKKPFHLFHKSYRISN